MTEPTKQRDGDQVLPTVNDLPFVQDAVIADIEKRKQVGIQRYGTPLQAFNGRDALRDWYEELLDGVMYAKQLMIERESIEIEWSVLLNNGQRLLSNDKAGAEADAAKYLGATAQFRPKWRDA